VEKGQQVGLAYAISLMLPTPQVMDCNDRQKSEKWKGDDLVSTIKDLARRGELLPTPRANTAMQAAINVENPRDHGNLEDAIAQSVAETGENGESAQRLGLAPEFVGAMMGFPTGWTNLKL
jgi:hypothetical protein